MKIDPNPQNVYNTLLYNKINGIALDDNDFDFMNHGYFPVANNTSHLLLDTSASLYCYLVNKFKSVANKSIIDIGCGRGGGTKHIRQSYDFSEVFGCDYNQKNIDQCLINSSNCNFRRENAETLECYEDGYFDLALNVESMHCYNDLSKFFDSVKRTLKQDGEFIVADIMDHEVAIEVEKELSKRFRVIEVEDITQNVKNSCEYMINKIDKIENKKGAHYIHQEIYIEKYETYGDVCFFYSFHLEKR